MNCDECANKECPNACFSFKCANFKAKETPPVFTAWVESHRQYGPWLIRIKKDSEIWATIPAAESFAVADMLAAVLTAYERGDIIRIHGYYKPDTTFHKDADNGNM